MKAARPAPTKAATPTGMNLDSAPLLVCVALPDEEVPVPEPVDLVALPVPVLEVLPVELPPEVEEPPEEPEVEEPLELPDEEEPRQLSLPALTPNGAHWFVAPVLSRMRRESCVPEVMLTVQVREVPCCSANWKMAAAPGSPPGWTLTK